MTRIPNTSTAVSYAYTVSINGSIVGTLQGFNPTSSKQLERVRQLQNETSDILEIVPGRTEHTIQLDRLELYDDDSDLTFKVLEEQTTPFNIVEKISNGQGKTREITYSTCWIQSIGKTIREGQINVAVSVTVWPTNIAVTKAFG